MKKILAIVFAVLMLVAPSAFAIDTGIGIGIDITTEDFAPLIWLCDDRVVSDDYVEPGRMSDGEDELLERINNYAFEGEQISWEVLVMDKNGIEKISDVFATIGSTQGTGNDIEANCNLDDFSSVVESECNARIDEEDLTGESIDPTTQAYFRCTFTVETPESMQGEYWVTVEVEDLDGLSSIIAENEYWFLNPIVALEIEGDLVFDEVRPGTLSYSDTLLVRNDAEAGSGVQLDMFISGTDFFDSSSSGAKCPTSNVLRLGDDDSDCDSGDAFCYYAVSGAYSTQNDNRNDAEGYVGINYGTSFGNSPSYVDFYGSSNGDSGGYEIMEDADIPGPYFPGNVLVPGAEHAITFRLNLPEPCNGDFDTGSLFFFGEAI